MFRSTTIAALGLWAALSAPVAAGSDTTLLTVAGPSGVQTYDLAALEAFEPGEFQTATIWTKGRTQFQGVPLKSLLDAAQITDGSILATAINDYAVEIPVAEITGDYPIVAYRMDGQVMSVRDKGPLWMIYPFDADPALQTEVTYSRSIWQLDRLVVKE